MPQAAPTASAIADLNGWDKTQTKERRARSEEGQFFTPLPIANLLAGWFRASSFNRSSIEILDPGAGGGVLTAAVVDRICALRANKELPILERITLRVWEQDQGLVTVLEETLDACVARLREVEIEANVLLKAESYISGAVQELNPGLFDEPNERQVTHAILNPPYRKLHSRSLERRQLSSVGIETSNLYSAFVWLAYRQLSANGELAAITPRSFCNGPYFREFRKEILGESEFSRVHVFDSRSEAFSRDQVLQENILYHLRKGKKSPSKNVRISTGPIESPVSRRVSRKDFVSLGDANRVIHIAPETGAEKIRSFFDTLPCQLQDLGIQVSTGPIVDFRLRNELSRELQKGCVPLIYPHCVKSGKVLPPLSKSDAYDNCRIKKKPVAIAHSETTQKWLVNLETFILIKRFTSKEERRRLVAGLLNPKDFIANQIGIENHLNFFHRNRGGIPTMLATGLCRFLNSTITDQYFRQFNGHTQVNATDLRMLRYPDLATLNRIGDLLIDDSDQQAIDCAIKECLDIPI